MRWTFHLILVFLLCLPLPLIAAEVRVGIYSNPPLCFVDEQGQTDGLFPEILQHVAQEKNWQLEFVSCTWQQCLEQLDSGDIDLLPAIAYTEARAEKYRFVAETLLTNWGQIYQRSGDNFDSILQLAGTRLAVLEKDVYYLGDQGLRQVAENFDLDVEFVEVTSYQEAFERLARGDVDLAMVGRVFGVQKQQQFNVLPTPLMVKAIQVRPAFSQQSDPELKTQFDLLVGEWKRTTGSIYYQLIDKWLGIPHPDAFLPAWLKVVLTLLAVILSLMVLMTLWARRQIRIKTLELAGKNRQLEDELIERQAVEVELRERQQQYRVLFEENQAIMMLIDPQTIEIVDVNPAACDFYRYPREKMQGMSVSCLNELNGQEIEDMVKQINSRQLLQFELVHKRADGERRYVEIQSSPIVIDGRSLICSIIRDISQRKEAEQQLEERNYFLQSVIDGVSDPLMVIGFDYQVLQMNEAARGKLSANLEANDRLACHQVSHASTVPCDGEDHPCPLKQVRETGETVTVIHNHFYEQKLRIVELSASPLYNADGDMYAVIEVARDITERHQIEELLSENEKRLHHLAHHDTLTDLPNRLLFEDRLKQALSKARRSRRQVALFFLDLDHFKDVNDNLGHDFGDLLLIDVANRLRNCVREADTVARLGGDEFLVLLDEIESIPMVEAMAERICNVLIHELSQDDYSQKLSASIGISIFPEDGINSQELMRSADQAMYKAKGKGKANYQFASAPQGHLNFE